MSNNLGIHVLLGIPTGSWARKSDIWIDALNSIQMPLGTSYARIRTNDMTIADARNALCRAALDQNATYLVMLGDDVIPPANLILLMLERIGRQEPLGGGQATRVDMVTGVYWTKGYPTEPYLWNTPLFSGSFRDWKVGDFVPVDLAGCDCLMIDVAMLRELPEPWFSTDWVKEQGDPPTPIQTEDFYFFSKARRAGRRLFVDTRIQCLHEDRGTGNLFGFATDMPQNGGTPEFGGKGLAVAEVGAGFWCPTYADGTTVVRFDMRPECKPDVRCDVRALPAEHFGRYDVVHASHVIEHFQRAEAPGLVRHWARLLKVGGQMVIRVPNFAYAARRILAGEDGTGHTDTYDWAQVYGDQMGVGPAHEHLNGFTPKKLLGLLRTHPCLGEIEVVETDEGGEPGINLKATATLVRADEMEAIGPWWDEIVAREGVAVPVAVGESVKVRLPRSENGNTPATESAPVEATY